MTLLQTVYQVQHVQLGPAGFSFLFVLLPLFLFVYYAVPVRLRPAVLLGESLVYYYLAEPKFLWLLVVSVGSDYALLRLMERFETRPRRRRACVGVSIAKNVALLLWMGVTVQLWSRPHLLGVQIYSFSAMGCLIDAYRGKVPSGQNIVRFSLYCAFFPRLYAGPLTSYTQFADQLGRVEMEPGRMLSGFGQFIQGLLKMSVIGGGLFQVYQAAGLLETVTGLSAWLRVFSLAFALYFMLSGFGDIAQGLGEMYGIALPKNFYYPYQSRNMGDFFQRFNITIHSFYLENVYKPLAGERKSPLTDSLCLLLMGMLSGLWFGLTLNYLVWGAYLALFVILERVLYPGLVKNIPTLFGRLLTLCVVLAGIPLFAGETLAESGTLLRSLFRFQSFYDDPVLYLLASNWLLLIVACFLATNVVNLGVVKLRRKAPTVAAVLFGAVDVGILAVFVALSLQPLTA